MYDFSVRSVAIDVVGHRRVIGAGNTNKGEIQNSFAVHPEYNSGLHLLHQSYLCYFGGTVYAYRDGNGADTS
jgi:hypothetical protein